MKNKLRERIVNMSISKDAISIFILLIISLGVAMIGNYNGHNWGGDFSQYIAQARAIDTSTIDEWFIKNSWIINNSSPGLGATAYPWLFPILIAPIYHFFGLNYAVYQIFLSCLFSLCVTGFYVFLRRRSIEMWIALVFCTLLLANREFLNLCRSIISDIPCLLFTIIAWIIVDRYNKERTITVAIITGFVCFLPFFTRTTGIVVIASLFIIDIAYFMRKGRDKEFNRYIIGTMCIPYIIWILCYIMGNAILPKGGESYNTYFSLGMQHISKNIQYYNTIIWEFVYQYQVESNHWFRVLTMVLLIPAIAVIVIGFIKQLINLDHIALYYLITMLMLIFYNYQQGTRFIITVFPLLLVFGYYGCISVIRSIRGKAVAFMIGSLLVLITISFSTQYLYRTIKEERTSAVDTENALNLYNYINSELTDDNTIYFCKPRVLYLYTDVYSYHLNGDLSLEDLEQCDFALCARTILDKPLEKIIEEDPSSFELCYENDDFRLYRHFE